MRRTSIIAAAIGSLFVSSSFAGFTLTAGAETAQGTKVARLFRAINDGVDTGTQLKALDLTFNLTGGKAYFSIDDSDFDGTGDTVAIANGANDNNFSFVRVGTAGQTFIVSSTPTSGTTQPNPWTGGVSQFSVVATTTAAVNATGLGAVFARLVLDPGTSGTITGSMGGDTGNKVPVSLTFGTVGPTNVAPVIAPVPPTPVVFGQIVTNGAPFSVTVNVADADAADVLALTVGAVAGITNVNVVGGGTSPQSFVVTGTVDYSLNGSTVNVPITATDGAGGHSVAGSFSLVVTPEPASLSLVGLSTLLLGRRRK